MLTGTQKQGGEDHIPSVVTKTLRTVMSGDEPSFSEDQQKVLKSMMEDAVKKVLQAEREKSRATANDWTHTPKQGTLSDSGKSKSLYDAQYQSGGVTPA